MTGIKSYSTTAANNVAANTGINWDEGMSPAAVNNSARAVLADVRSQFNDLAWFAYGNGDLYVAPVYVSGTSFKIAGIDVTSAYEVGRRVKAVGSGTGTIYGTISLTAFSTDTTVVVTWDSGSLSNETLTIYLSQIPATGDPISPNAIAGYETGTWTPSDASGAGLSFSAVSAAYTRIGNMVFAYASWAFPSTADVTAVEFAGLPYTPANANYARQGILSYAGTANAGFCITSIGQPHFRIYTPSGVQCTNAQLSGVNLFVMLIYPIT